MARTELSKSIFGEDDLSRETKKVCFVEFLSNCSGKCSRILRNTYGTFCVSRNGFIGSSANFVLNNRFSTILACEQYFLRALDRLLLS